MEDSKVVKFLRMICDNTKDGSWMRLNSALQTGLGLAIDAKFKFERNDFKEISQKFDFRFWGGNSYPVTGESFYSRACEKNRSAAIAFEEWQKRKPFRYFGKRLAIGSEFDWWEKIPELANDESKLKIIVEHGYKATRIQVSSFSKCGNFLNAVWYKNSQWKRKSGERPDRQFRLKREDLKAVEKALKPEKKKSIQEVIESLNDEQMCCCNCGHIAGIHNIFQIEYPDGKDGGEFPICPVCKEWNTGGFPSYAPVGVWQKDDLKTLVELNLKKR